VIDTASLHIINYITHRYIQCTLYLNDMHSGTI
jgi:hypothetical protein